METYFTIKWKWKWSRSVVSDPQWPPRTAAFQAPLCMGFSRQEHWSGVPLPTPYIWIRFVFILFTPKYILISGETSSLTHVLFGNVLHNLHVIGNFSITCLLLISNLIPLWEKTLYCFYSFKFVEVCVMPQNMAYLGKCFLWAWENVYSAVVRWSRP